MAQDVLDGDLEHVGAPVAELLHAVEDRVGGGLEHLVDDLAVGEEQHPVGVGGRGRLVGDHDDGLPELVDRACA